MEGNLTWVDEHTMQYTDDVLQNYTPETYMILLTNVTVTNSIKKLKIGQKAAPKAGTHLPPTGIFLFFIFLHIC